MFLHKKEPPLRQQERLWNISEDIHLINENIVSSSEQSRKPEHSFHAGCYFYTHFPALSGIE
nr:MAG TPA_asm: hypothetical protein [Caudoviricetes sp.]